jgi:cobalt-zinc-cadmium efflux system membrane fusion protein
MKEKIAYSSALIGFALLALSRLSWAHGGAIEVNSTGHQGPVHLTPTQISAIDLKTASADPHPIAELFSLNGEVQLLPNAQADISTRISGQVTAVYSSLGDKVTEGQTLAKIQSRLVGDPPPSVIITSPMEGIIDARNINLGQSIEPNTILFHVSNRTQMQVVARVYEEDVSQVHLGQSSTIHLLSDPHYTFTGKVVRIDPNVDPLTRTCQVWLDVDNTADRLKPNMFAKTNIILKNNPAAVAIPNEAIIEANDEKFVFVQDGENYTRTEIKIGAADDHYTEITDGLIPGDKVVTQGNREVYTQWLTGGQTKAEE